MSETPSGTFIFKIAAPNLGQTFTFYPEISFGLSLANSYIKYSNIPFTVSVVCKPESTVITAPTLLPNTGSYSYYQMVYPATLYELG